MFKARYVLACALLGAICGLPGPAAAVISYARVCSIYGANYYYIPGTDTCVNAETGITKQEVSDGNGGTTTVTGETALKSQIDDIDGRITRAFQNASIAAALAAPDLVQGEHFGLRINWGNAGQANAVGLTGAAMLTEGPGDRLEGTLGIAFAGKAVGGNAGLQFNW